MDKADSGQGRSGQARSIAQFACGFTASAAPLNGVKIDLAVILCLAVPLWLVLDRLTPDVLIQFAALGAAGLVGMIWIIVRARRVLRSYEAQAHGPGRPHDGEGGRN